MSKLQQLVFEMLTTNTGTHFLDSGGANGRHWQQNEGLTIDYFKNEPQATLDLSYGYPDVTVSVFHKLTGGTLELNELCHEFNAMECDTWNGDFYGTNADQSEWLELNGFTADNDGWNTYNWECNLSQTLQGTDLTHSEYEDKYILIQIHQGADVRGGYTDAKLFKVADHCEPVYAILDDCSFSFENKEGEIIGIDCYGGGEYTNQDGELLDDDDFKQFAILANNKPVEGFITEY